MGAALIQHLFSFDGRITRRAFWLRYMLPMFGVFALVRLLIPIDAPLVDIELFDRGSAGGWVNPFSVMTSLGKLYVVGHLVVIGWIGTISGVKRLHDIGLPGWLMLVAPVLAELVPLIGALFFVLLGFFPGSKGPNRFGPNPRYSQ